MQKNTIDYKKKADIKVYLFILVSLCFFISGCSSLRGSNKGILENAQNAPISGPKVDISGFTLPQLPENLEANNSPRNTNYASLPYIVNFIIEDKKNPILKEALKIIEERSILLALQKQLPRDRLTLEKRLEQDTKEAEIVLHSLGYYSATVEPIINYSTYPVQVVLNIEPNEAYILTSADIIYPKNFNPQVEGLEDYPKSLFYFGLEENSKPIANNILDATALIKPWYVDRGYPFAELSQSLYFAYPEEASFKVEVPFSPNEYIMFGDTIIKGSNALTKDYLERIYPWKKGEAWNQSLLRLFQEELLSIGIFSFVNPTIDINSIGEERDIIIELIDAPSRTWGGGVNYDITREFGIQLFWEHRNLFKEAESFTVNTVLWKDTQEVRFNFAKPDYQEKYRDFKSEFLLKNEMTDAYETTSASLDVGIEDIVSLSERSRFIFSYYASFELGIEKDASNFSRSQYMYGGLPLQISYKDEDYIFDPSTGQNIDWTISPYMGTYHEEFSLVWTELMLTKYFEIIDDKKLILALKGKGGMLSSYSAEEVPASLRFYVGGGNSVRGYPYQSVGPKNSSNDPIGGASFLEGAIELRYKLFQSMSIVPFFDFGNVFEKAMPDVIDFKYSAGLGLRFFTPIGPLRFDVAVPIENKTIEPKDFQLYVSIGQSF